MGVLISISLVLFVTLIFVKFEHDSDQRGFNFRPAREIVIKIGLSSISALICFFFFLVGIFLISNKTGDMEFGFAPLAYIVPSLLVSVLAVSYTDYIGAMLATYITPIPAVVNSGGFEDYERLVEYGYLILGSIWACVFLVVAAIRKDAEEVTKQALLSVPSQGVDPNAADTTSPSTTSTYSVSDPDN